MGRNSETRVRRGSGILAAILWFLIGFILALSILVGAVAYIYYADLDSLTKQVADVSGMQNINNRDEEGNAVYINTDEVKNLMQLVGTVSALSADKENLTLGQLEYYFPVAKTMVEKLADNLSKYVEVDLEELRSVKFATDELQVFIRDTVYKIVPATLMEANGMGGMLSNPFASLLLYGKEASCITLENGEIMPLYYDVYVANGSDYVLKSDSTLAVKEEWKPYLNEEGISGDYYLYYYVNKDNRFVADKANNAATSEIYTNYSAERETCSGYYYMQDGEKVVLTLVTIGMLAESDFNTLLDDMYICDLLDMAVGNVEFVNKIFKDVKVADLKSSDGINAVLDRVAVLDLISTEDSLILNVFDGVTLGQLMNDPSSVMNGISIAKIMDVKATDSIVAYLAYGIYDVNAVEGASNSYTAKYEKDGKKYDVNVTTDEAGIITSATYTDNAGTLVTISSTPVTEVQDKVNGVTTSLTVKDLMGSSFDANNKLMAAIGDKKINEINVDNIMLSDVMDVTADNAIMMYIAYGVQDLTGTPNVEGKAVNITTDEKGNVTSVTYKDNGDEVAATPVSKVGDKVNGVTTTLTVKDLMGSSFDANNKLMAAIGDKKINEINVDNIMLSDVMDVTADNAIMMYLAYGVQDLTGTPNIEGKAVTITTDEKGYVTSVKYENGDEVAATPVSQVANKVNGVTDNLTVKDIMGSSFDANNKLMAAIGDKKISEIDSDSIMVSDVMDVTKSDTILLYIAYGVKQDGDNYYVGDQAVNLIMEDDKVVDVQYATTEQSVPKTPVSQISSKVSGITNELTIKQILGSSFDENNRLMVAIGNCKINEVTSDKIMVADVMDIAKSDTIMLYIAYSVKEDDGKYYVGEEEVKLITTEGDVVTDVQYADGSSAEKTPVSQISSKVNNINKELTIKQIMGSSFDENNRLMVAIGDKKINEINVNSISFVDVIDVDPEEAMTMYVAYSITEVKLASDGENYTGLYNLPDESTVPAFIKTKNIDGKTYVQSVHYTDENGEIIESSSIAEINEKIGNITHILTLGDVISIDESDKILWELKDYKLDEVAKNVGSSIKLSNIISSVDATDSLMMYVAYGVKGYNAETGKAIYKNEEGVECTVDVVVEEGKVVAVNYEDGTPTEGVTVDRASVILDDIRTELTLGEIIDCSDNRLLSAISGYTLNTLNQAMDTLTLKDVIDAEIDDKVTTYLVYSAQGIEQIDATTYSATVDEQPVTIKVASDGKTIESVKFNSTGKDVPATLISEAGKKAKEVATHLRIGDLCEIQSDDIILNALKDVIISDVPNAMAKLTLQELYAKEIYGTDTMYIANEYNKNYVYYTADGELAGTNGKLTESEFTPATYYTYGATKGVWTFLLRDSEGSEQLHSIQDMSSLMNNATVNLSNATLYELCDAGIINASKSDLDKKLRVPQDGGVVEYVLGECALQQLIELVISLAH